MDAVTAVDWTWLGGIAVVAVLLTASIWVVRRRRNWPDHLTFESGDAPRRSPGLVHVLAPGEAPSPRSPQSVARIDPERHYVFGEYEPETASSSRTRVPRHDAYWALRQSTRRRRMARGSVAVLLAAAVALTILVLIGSTVHHPPQPPVHHGLAALILVV